MNGPQHYAEAERLLGRAGNGDFDSAWHFIGEAQVHATLALAAATALAIDPTPEAVAAWDPHLLDQDDEDDVVEAHIACGQPLNPGHDEPSCVLDEGHEDYHADGHGNRWTT